MCCLITSIISKFQLFTHIFTVIKLKNKELGYISFEMYFMAMPDTPWDRMSISLLRMATEIFSFSIMVLFFNLLIVVSFTYQDLTWEIEKNVAGRGSRSAVSAIRCELDSWKQKNAHSAQIVSQLNNVFGLTILLVTSNCFVAFINCCYQILIIVQVPGPSGLPLVHYCLRLFNFFLIMTMITYTPNKIRSEAVKAIKALRKLSFDDTVAQYQVDFTDFCQN